MEIACEIVHLSYIILINTPPLCLPTVPHGQRLMNRSALPEAIRQLCAVFDGTEPLEEYIVYLQKLSPADVAKSENVSFNGTSLLSEEQKFIVANGGLIPGTLPSVFVPTKGGDAAASVVPSAPGLDQETTDSRRNSTTIDRNSTSMMQEGDSMHFKEERGLHQSLTISELRSRKSMRRRVFIDEFKTAQALIDDSSAVSALLEDIKKEQFKWKGGQDTKKALSLVQMLGRTCVIRPHSRTWWDNSIAVLALFSIIIVPLQATGSKQ